MNWDELVGQSHACTHTYMVAGEAKSWKAPVTLCGGSQRLSMRSSTWTPVCWPQCIQFSDLETQGYMESALASGSCNAFSSCPSEVMKTHFCCFLSVMTSHNSFCILTSIDTEARTGRLMKAMSGPTAEESAEQERGCNHMCKRKSLQHLTENSKSFVKDERKVWGRDFMGTLHSCPTDWGRLNCSVFLSLWRKFTRTGTPCTSPEKKGI